MERQSVAVGVLSNMLCENDDRLCLHLLINNDIPMHFFHSIHHFTLVHSLLFRTQFIRLIIGLVQPAADALPTSKWYIVAHIVTAMRRYRQSHGIAMVYWPELIHLIDERDMENGQRRLSTIRNADCGTGKNYHIDDLSHIYPLI